ERNHIAAAHVGNRTFVGEAIDVNVHRWTFAGAKFGNVFLWHLDACVIPYTEQFCGKCCFNRTSPRLTSRSPKNPLHTELIVKLSVNSERHLMQLLQTRIVVTIFELVEDRLQLIN